MCNSRGIGNHIIHANVTYGDCPLGEQVSLKHKPLIDLETPSHNVLHASREAAAVGCITKVRYSDLVGNDEIRFNTAIRVSGTGQSLVKTIKSKANNGIRVISHSATHYQPDQQATHYHCFISFPTVSYMLCVTTFHNPSLRKGLLIRTSEFD